MPPPFAITDKRAYQPLCSLCHDSGCGACDGQQAAMLGHRVKQQETEVLAGLSRQFIDRHWPKQDGQLISLRSYDEMLEIIMRAIDYGRQMEREKSEPAGEREQCSRFERLEVRNEQAKEA